MTDSSPVGFQLGFARSSCADAAAEPRQRGARADEAWHQVFELRELDLQLALPCSGAAGEDVEDQLRPIDTFRSSACFEIAQLRRAELVVENDEVDRRFVARRRQHVTLPLPRNVAGSGLARSCSTRRPISAPAAAARPAELVERMFRIEMSLGVLEKADERRPFPLHSSDLITRSYAIAPGTDQPERAGTRLPRSSTAHRRA